MPRISQNYDEDAARDPIQDLIWKAGIKATAPRMAVVKALQAERQPLSIARLHAKLDGVSQTSIYRTLEALVRSGSVSRIDAGAAHALYEIIDGRSHHHHVICRKCGDMEDIELSKGCPGWKVGHAALASSEKFASISGHALELFGLCNACA